MLDQPVAGAHVAWSLYRQCSATSRFYKSRLERLTKVSLGLGLGGALAATLGQVLPGAAESKQAKMISVMASLLVALAGLAATRAAGSEYEKIWLRCRGAGESLKSSVYLYCASVPPFHDQNRAAALAQTVERSLHSLEGIALRAAQQTNLPPEPLSVDTYIVERVQDQTRFYSDRAKRYQSKADFWHTCSIAGSAVSAALGAVSVLYAVSAWIALIATATASVTAFVNNQRYAGMISLYQNTAVRLQMLESQWRDSAKTDVDRPERNSFIRTCEETMARENGAWTEQWLVGQGSAEGAKAMG